METAIGIIGLAIALAGAVIAAAQVAIARATFEFGLFDRRHKIYFEAKEFLADVVAYSTVPAERVAVYRQVSSDAKFVLDDKIAAYLKELEVKARKVRRANDVYENRDRYDAETLNRAIQEKHELAIWFGEQFDVLDAQFTPALRSNKGFWSWLLKY